ncbi:SDR family NAD(P)-dependent oxidoreductase [Lentzea sp. NPDC059081]|uniref:SDR family NAD(P)-dependent oxidoreductase n=1 Tax=Lentzea sp. NPDC059081 TaxID=3346719 RepID=UPI003676F872
MTSILITGGHSGIGLAASRALAARGFDLVLAGRSPDRMAEVAAALRSEHGVSVTPLALDLASLVSVREAAARLRTLLDSGEVSPLDAILCNAGGRLGGDVTYSADGHEMTFAANCLGHFLLVELLLPALSEKGRIVYTASGTHDPDTLDGKLVGAVVHPDAIALASTGKNGAKPVSSEKRYTTSKLCTVMCAYELHRRLRKAGSAVSSIAYDPGSVADTEFMRGMPAPVRRLMGSGALRWVMRRIGVTTSEVGFSGASLAALAVDAGYASGKYFQAKEGVLAERRSSRLSYEEALAGKLWEDSKVLVGLTVDEEPAALR